jgi:AbrB family looped-hinge helix DNA binding protein
MPSAALTSKGQITIPASVRRALQVDTGDKVQFIEVEAGRYEIVAAAHPVTALKGMFGRPAKAVSIKHMNKAIAAAGARAR